MLLPQQLRRMRLGCQWHPGRTFAPDAVAASGPVPEFHGAIQFPALTGHNDEISDCVPTAYCNIVANWRAADGDTVPLSNDLPVDLYKAAGGYDGTPATDNGMDPEAMWPWARDHAVGGYRLASFLRLDPTDEGAIRRTIEKRYAVAVVMKLLDAQFNQRVLEPTPNSPMAGYHMVMLNQFVGPLTDGISWGEPMVIDRPFWPAQITIAYGLRLEKA